MLLESLYIDKTRNAGKGVFTNEKLENDTLIEISPVIVMDATDRVNLDKTKLHDYIFEWGEAKDKCCMALGFVPMYNHSYKSNCQYFMDFDEEMIFIKTVRDVAAGEELTINYNWEWDDQKKVWFEVNGE